MKEFESFMNADVTLKRWRLYALRFGLLVFAWTALKLGFLDLVTEYSTRVFVWPTFAMGVMVAVVVSIAVYGMETNSKRVKVLIVLVLFVLVCLLVADRIRGF